MVGLKPKIGLFWCFCVWINIHTMNKWWFRENVQSYLVLITGTFETLFPWVTMKLHKIFGSIAYYRKHTQKHEMSNNVKCKMLAYTVSNHWIHQFWVIITQCTISFKKSFSTHIFIITTAICSYVLQNVGKPVGTSVTAPRGARPPTPRNPELDYIRECWTMLHHFPPTTEVQGCFCYSPDSVLQKIQFDLELKTLQPDIHYIFFTFLTTCLQSHANANC